MSTRTLLVLGLAWCLVGTPGAALAQQPSLAEVARQEAARRKSVESSKKVYSNQDLNKGRPLTTGAVAKTAPAAADAATPEPEPGQGPQDEPSAPSTSPSAESKTPAATDDPEIIGLRMALASATESSKGALGDVEGANVTIVNLFDETQRNAAVAKRDARLADYRKYQNAVGAINKQIADREAALEKAQAAKQR